MRKVGDKVKIKKDLKSGEKYGNCLFIYEMSHFINKEVTILKYCRKEKWYRIKEDSQQFRWTEQMFAKENDNMSEIEELKKQVEEIKKQIEKLEKGDAGLKTGDIYYIITWDGDIDHCFWTGVEEDLNAFSRGNAFKTKEEAIFESERRKTIAEMKPFSFEPDWNDMDQDKTFLMFDASRDKTVAYTTMVNNYGGLYFKTRQKAEECIEIVGKERIKKYYFGVK